MIFSIIEIQTHKKKNPIKKLGDSAPLTYFSLKLKGQQVIILKSTATQVRYTHHLLYSVRCSFGCKLILVLKNSSKYHSFFFCSIFFQKRFSFIYPAFLMAIWFLFLSISKVHKLNSSKKKIIILVSYFLHLLLKSGQNKPKIYHA